MAAVKTCTWAPTTLAAPDLTRRPAARTARHASSARRLSGTALAERLLAPVRKAEALGVDYLLVAQRWWGTGEEIEGSSYDCLAMTDFYAARTERIRLITAVHPGFFLPGPIAKWSATLDRLTAGRWSINVTSGWHEAEFGMFGAELLEHDERYARTSEFIQILRGTWTQEEFSFSGRFYRVVGLRLEPRPSGPLEVFQGGQSEAALTLAARHSDWMFLNGGPPEKVAGIIERVRKKTRRTGRRVRFALYAIPLCRATDAEAEAEIAERVAAVDPDLLVRRGRRVGGAQGMWAERDNRLAMLDSNEGYASGLIGSPETIFRRMREFHRLGVDCFHLTLHDQRFNREVLPALKELV